MLMQQQDLCDMTCIKGYTKMKNLKLLVCASVMKLKFSNFQYYNLAVPIMRCN